LEIAGPKLIEYGERTVAKKGEIENLFPTEEQIRHHAYELYLARRNSEPGSDLDDWLTAEAQLRAAGKSTMQLVNRSADVK
jgi:hypothetical protein